MDLQVDFSPLLAKIQGYLVQYLDKETKKFNDDLGEEVNEFTAFMTKCISEESADPESLQSLHNLLLASSGIVELDESDSHVQSALAKLSGAAVPACLYLASLPAGLAPCLRRLLAETPRPAELRSAVVAACCDHPVVWSAVPPALAACVETVGAGDVAADAGMLVALLAASDPADCQQALALASCLVILLERLLEPGTAPTLAEDADNSDNKEAPLAKPAAAAVVVATTLFRKVTLSVWLEWAEQDASPGGPSVQSAIAAALREVAELTEEARREGRAGRLPAGMDALLETCAPYAGQREISRQERLQGVAARDARSRRHLHALIGQLDVTDGELVECVEKHADLVSPDDLWRLLEAVKNSAEQQSELRDRLIKVLTGALLKESPCDRLRSLTEHVLTTCPNIRSSSWEQELRMTSAQLVGGSEDAVSEASARQMCSLLLQSPRGLLDSLVQQTAESSGKAAIMASLLPAINQRLPLHKIRTDKAGLTESLILDRMSEISDPKPFRQLSQLLTSAVRCGVTSLDQQLAERVAGLSSPRGLTLQLIQDLMESSAALSPAWCCPLALVSAESLDETLDMGTDAEQMTGQRQAALHCIRLMEKVDGELDPGGRLSPLLVRCHPITEQYVCRYALRRPPAAPQDPLLRCLTEQAPPPWRQEDHTLIKATLASYLPYFCSDEWRSLHSALLEYHSGTAPLVGPAPAEHRPLARVAWYYGDLVTLWTVQEEEVHPDQSLLVPQDRLTVAARAIAVQIKRTLETCAAEEQYAEQLSAVFLPLTHIMTLVKDVTARDPLDMLALYITAEFIKQLTSRMSEPRPAPEGPVSPCADWELEGMDASAGVLSQFVVGCFNIPNDSPVKKRVLQHISGSVLSSMAPLNGQPG